MVTNELYLISFVMQLLGLRWFVQRQPMRRRWPWVAVALVLTAYTFLYLKRIPYCGNVSNLTTVVQPGNPEHYYSLRFRHSFKNFQFCI